MIGLDKGEIRKKYKEIRKHLKGNICDKFYENEMYLNSEQIFTFVNYGSEIGTKELIKRALKDNKRVAVPYMTGKEHEMIFIEINSLEELKENKIGIPEPDYNESKISKSNCNTLVIVPGLAFDREFYRVGYGGGFYDKYLSENEYGCAVGVCFNEQITDSLPREKTDKCVDAVVTENKIIINGRKKMKSVIEMCESAKSAKRTVANMTTGEKNNVLVKAAEALRNNYSEILKANEIDLENGKNAGLKGSIIDRLALSKERIYDMAEGLEAIAKLPDPIGEYISMKTLPNGLTVGQKRVPMGVIGIIYEARPNVTSDAFGLCIKAGSAVILRGGKEAINSNKAIVSVFKKVINELGINEDIVQLVEDTSRESANQMMKMNGYIDLLIPRGGAGLIQAVVKNSTVPVIETGVGNCHVFVDESANIENAVNIIVNAKAQRPGVCNAAETLLVHKNIAERYLPLAVNALREQSVEIRGDEKVKAIIGDVVDASEEDWATEYLDKILAVRVVENIDEAIEHIIKYSTGHSECIVSEDYTNTQRFLQEIDSAAVYVNASTRFTDGNEFGFGAEIGISTQKLHARGPMGLREITTSKYVIYGNGQIRK